MSLRIDLTNSSKKIRWFISVYRRFDVNKNYSVTWWNKYLQLVGEIDIQIKETIEVTLIEEVKYTNLYILSSSN